MNEVAHAKMRANALANAINKRQLERPRQMWLRLKLDESFFPIEKFGNASAFGSIYRTKGNKIMKISKWTANSAREMKIAKIAGNASVGPRVYNTRKIHHDYQTWAVMTMDKVKNAKSLYNAINNGTVTHFKQISNVVNALHRAGIHHGNLHGGNILVYKNANGTLKFVPIDFGASKHHPKITNAASSVKYAIQRKGWRGGSVIAGGNNTIPAYSRPGRSQLIRSNANMLRNLRSYFNYKTQARARG